jgi:hypothetical protein
MMKLMLPLDNYDEAGRVKPPSLLFAALVFLLRPMIVFIASVTFREDQTKLLSLFYPDKYQFYMSLSHAVPALIILLIMSFREKIWDANNYPVISMIPILLVFAFISDACVQVYILQSESFGFSWPHASSFIGLLLFGLYTFKSQHLRVMLADWKKPA